MQIIIMIEASSNNLTIEIQLQLLVSIVLRSLLFEEVSCAKQKKKRKKNFFSIFFV